MAGTFESLVMPGPVINGHAKYENDCSSCHTNFSKAKQKALCLDCHDKVSGDIDRKQGFHGRINNTSQECKICHTEHKGRKADIIKLNIDTFDHSKTDFSLEGKHLGTSCTHCHMQGKLYRDTPGLCFDCHEKQDIHNNKLGKQCQDCHKPTAWKKTVFNHDKTEFQLNGKHKDVKCISCHIDNKYDNLPSTCHSCHILNDVHNGQYGKKCHTCHSERGWKKVQFDHDKTEFPLEGKHDSTKCTACHIGDLYKDELKTNCYSCHKHDDIHKGRNTDKCNDCHSPKSWDQINFNHDKDTEFSLHGKHAKLECTSCHKGHVKKETLETDCLFCHKQDDVHKGQEGKQCKRCHNEDGWDKKVLFDHDLSGFPLSGLHASTTCEECHISAAYKDTAADCITCHKKDDVHKQWLPEKCEQCHNPNSWSLWAFDHNTQTDYSLENAHEGLECHACHKTRMNILGGTSTSCYSCHQQDDVHQGKFGNYCERCHGTNDFSDIKLMH